MPSDSLKHLRAVVAGGSIGGLCAGVALRGSGATVDIYERHPGKMEMRGAGIVVQGELMEILQRHEAPPLPTTSCRGRRYLKPGGGDGNLQTMPQQFTSWVVTVRSFKKDDLPSILRIERESFDRDAWSQEVFLEYARTAPALFLVASVAGRIAGYSIACLVRHGAEIASLAVRPQYRQEGVATMLLKTTIRNVRRSGAQAVYEDTAIDKTMNIPAKK